jgi:hypothetical protein
MLVVKYILLSALKASTKITHEMELCALKNKRGRSMGSEKGIQKFTANF